MKHETDFLKAYYAEVSRRLLCGRKEKRAILNSLRADVEAYQSENGALTPETAAVVFGTPEEIAAGVLQGADPAALKRKLTIRRAVLIALALALLIWAAFAVAGLIDVHTEAHGTFEEEILAIFAGGGLLP